MSKNHSKGDGEQSGVTFGRGRETANLTMWYVIAIIGGVIIGIGVCWWAVNSALEDVIKRIFGG